MGGISGLIYSSLPVVVFVPVSTLFGLMPAIGAALGVAALILVWRLVRRESVAAGDLRLHRRRRSAR